ncbi:hypothetical protein BgiBS90_013397 [Biomphalaria glabrata]|nr:hypothetical protein BgiBS90_013397 [Biomphalaria glabrata]
MAILIVLAMFVCYCQGQYVAIPSNSFTVPASAFRRGGTVSFVGSSLTDVCRQLMAYGGKEALSDGMGAAAKYFAHQKIPGAVAGGNDPQMQCLYQQATGSMMPGMVGATDPGNMFGDYFDTVIEYPMILDPCANPQCNGKVNPTVLLMQAFAPRMGMGMTGMGGMTSGFPGMGGMTSGFPGMGGMTGASGFPTTSMGGNPMSSMYSNNPLLAMLTGMTNAKQPAVPTTPTAAPTKTQQSTGGFPPQFAQMMQMFQNPQMAQMFKQFMSSQGVPSSGPSPMMPF